jgi:hypothetical protein
MNGYYITKDNPTVKIILEPQDSIYIFNMNLIKLVLPIGGKRVWCEHNKLKELIIPEGYNYVNCHDNKLKKLIVSKNCHVVFK